MLMKKLLIFLFLFKRKTEFIFYLQINTDYEKTYPDNNINLSECWLLKFNQMVKFSSDKLSLDQKNKLIFLEQNDETVSSLSKYIIQLNILLDLFTPKGRKKLKNSKTDDSRESVYLHVKLPGDIEQLCKAKINQKAKSKATLQPYLIVVGPNELDLRKIYIQIDSFRFEANTFTEGFDLLFKFYLIFQLAYPIESESFWYFLQWGIYEIKTKADVQIPFVYSILNKLKKVQ